MPRPYPLTFETDAGLLLEVMHKNNGRLVMTVTNDSGRILSAVELDRESAQELYDYLRYPVRV